MAFCRSCGKDMGTSASCPHCGASDAAVTAPASSGDFPTAGLEQNIAGLLSYLFGWVSGLIFLLVDKRPFVRFHAAQSIALFLACFGAWIVFVILTMIVGTIVAAAGGSPFGFLMGLLGPVLMLVFLAAFILCMVKAYMNEKYKLPVIGNIVEKMLR